MTEYEQFRSDHFDTLAKQFDWVCEQRLKSVHEQLSNERPPYPPPHTVTLARAVHVLAMRTLADQHPAKHTRLISYTSNGRHGLHLYWQAVFRLNDVINHAAKTGGLHLRDRLTSVPIQEWRIPSKVEACEWERCAIYPNDDRQAADRKAIEIMATENWPLLATHFDADVVVSLAEFDAWAASTGIAEAGGVVALLHDAEEKMAKRSRVTDAAIAADERGEQFDLSKFESEQHPEQSPAKPAPVVAVVALNDEAWKTKARERAAEIIKSQRGKDLYPNQESLGDEIAREFRAAGIVGADGKPLSGATIKRHALKGVSSAQGKQLSTRTGRGK